MRRPVFEYELRKDGAAELIAYPGFEKEIIIPNRLDGHPIAAARRNPLYDDSGYAVRKVKDCTVKVAKDHPYLATISGVLFGKTDRKLIAYPAALGGTSYAVPAGIVTVGDAAFAGCTTLREITVPDSVGVIGDGAFDGCAALEEIALPDGLERIGKCAFRGCGSLRSVRIPSGVTSVERAAFYCCGALTDVTLPDSVTAVGDYAFFLCGSLRSVTIPDSVTSIGDYAFEGCAGDLTLTVTPGSYAEAWCEENGVRHTALAIDFGDAPTDWLTGA